MVLSLGTKTTWFGLEKDCWGLVSHRLVSFWCGCVYTGPSLNPGASHTDAKWYLLSLNEKLADKTKWWYWMSWLWNWAGQDDRRWLTKGQQGQQGQNHQTVLKQRSALVPNSLYSNYQWAIPCWYSNNSYWLNIAAKNSEWSELKLCIHKDRLCFRFINS